MNYTVDPGLAPEAIAKAREIGDVHAELIVWVAVHGALQLSLRHPQFQGTTRQWVEGFVDQLGRYLVERGMLTEAILGESARREAAFRRAASLPVPAPEEE